MKRTLYLAYGSNLNVRQMAGRCPGAYVVGQAVLKDYCLTFRGNWRGNGVANIEPKKGSSVPVAIWAISEANREALDRYEGAPFLYQGVPLPFTYGGKTYHGLCYIMNEGFDYAAPSPSYYGTILEGYDDFEFDVTPLQDAAMEATFIATHRTRENAL